MAKKPNILIIWGDDIGISNLSCYSEGLMVRRGQGGRAATPAGARAAANNPRLCPAADYRAAAPRSPQHPHAHAVAPKLHTQGYRTPNIDRIAKEGLRFTGARAAAVCNYIL